MPVFSSIRLPDGERRFVCPACFKQFTKKSNASRHYYSLHSATGAAESVVGEGDDAELELDVAEYIVDNAVVANEAQPESSEDDSSDVDDDLDDVESIVSDEASSTSSSDAESDDVAVPDDYTTKTPCPVALFHLKLAALLDSFNAPHAARIKQARLALRNLAPNDAEASTSHRHHQRVMRQFLHTTEILICSKCKRLLANRPALCEVCGGNEPVDTAVMLDVGKQLANMFSDPATWSLQLKHRQRLQHEPFSYGDILDGTVAREFHLLASDDRVHFTLVINTDGIDRFRSVNGSIWPVLGTISELPPIHRRYLEHRVLVGVYFGRRKPTDSFFCETVTRLNKAHDIG